jgi:hypothetical protein
VRQAGALAHQLEYLLVDRVDLVTQFLEIVIHGVVQNPS